MLILPYQTRFNAQSLPAVTLLLIAINCAVYLFLQSGDAKRYAALQQAYSESVLPGIELPRYRRWLEKNSEPAAKQRLQLLNANPAAASKILLTDSAFQVELQNGRVILESDPQFSQWQQARQKLDTLQHQIVQERFSLKRSGPWWQLFSHQFLHGSLMHLLGNMVILLVAGPFAEAALGRLRFAVGYLLAGAVAGVAHLALTPLSLVGASGAISGAMAMVAVLYGLRQVKVFYWVFVYFDTIKLPALVLLPIWIIKEAVEWVSSSNSGLSVAYWAHLGGLLGGGAYAWLMRLINPRQVEGSIEAEFADEKQAEKRSSLLRQAQEAAARLDTKRATRLYRELVELHPESFEYLSAYFNMALLGHDTEPLTDAALRVLWFRAKTNDKEIRKIYLQMSQPKVLQQLPVDEQLRLARRLVRSREDATALRVLDRLINDANLRNLYGRQIADCLLGLFTTYSRYGLKSPAEQVRTRLKTHFPSPATMGGLAPNSEPPLTIRASTQSRSVTGRPSTVHLDLRRQ